MIERIVCVGGPLDRETRSLGEDHFTIARDTTPPHVVSFATATQPLRLTRTITRFDYVLECVGFNYGDRMDRVHFYRASSLSPFAAVSQVFKGYEKP